MGFSDYINPEQKTDKKPDKNEISAKSKEEESKLFTVILEVTNEPPDGLDVKDPRSDMSEDSHLWELLFKTAVSDPAVPDALFWRLKSMRILGTRLKKSRKTGDYVLRPGIGKNMWPSKDAYREEADHAIKPYHYEFTELLMPRFKEACKNMAKGGVAGD